MKVRVLSKTDLHTFTNARGHGHVFRFDVIVIAGSEICITCFNIPAKQFHSSIDIGKLYTISKGLIKPAKKQFNHLKNDWEINLANNSTIETCLHDEHSIENHNFIFTPINELPTLINNYVVDIIGVAICINPLVTIMRKNGMETHKRTLPLKYMSSYSIKVTLWGVLCNKYNLEKYATINRFPIIAIKAGKITDFNKTSITTTFSSQLYINSDLKETRERCNQRAFECEYRYIFQFTIEENTWKADVTAFQDVANQVIGITALKLSEYGYQGKTKETTTIFSKLFFNRYLFKLAIHEETFSNQKHIKNIVIA